MPVYVKKIVIWVPLAVHGSALAKNVDPPHAIEGQVIGMGNYLETSLGKLLFDDYYGDNKSVMRRPLVFLIHTFFTF